MIKLDCFVGKHCLIQHWERGGAEFKTIIAYILRELRDLELLRRPTFFQTFASDFYKIFYFFLNVGLVKWGGG